MGPRRLLTLAGLLSQVFEKGVDWFDGVQPDAGFLENVALFRGLFLCSFEFRDNLQEVGFCSDQRFAILQSEDGFPVAPSCRSARAAWAGQMPPVFFEARCLQESQRLERVGLSEELTVELQDSFCPMGSVSERVAAVALVEEIRVQVAPDRAVEEPYERRVLQLGDEKLSLHAQAEASVGEEVLISRVDDARELFDFRKGLGVVFWNRQLQFEVLGKAYALVCGVEGIRPCDDRAPAFRRRAFKPPIRCMQL